MESKANFRQEKNSAAVLGTGIFRAKLSQASIQKGSPALAEERLNPLPESFQIANGKTGQDAILKRLNALEATNKKLEKEIKSLRKQLQNSSGTYAANPIPSEDKSKGAYLTAGAGILMVSDLTAQDDVDFEPTGVDSSWSNEVGIGYRFNRNFRGEFTYGTNIARNKNKINDSDRDWDGNWFETSSLFASAYYDFMGTSKLSPYLGIGLGTTTVHTNLNYSGSTDSEAFTFGYQSKIGISYAAFESTDLFLEGIYQGTKAFNLGGDNFNPLEAWAAHLGVRYKL